VIGEIADQAVEEEHRAGDLLFRSGEEAKDLYILEEGSVEIFIGERGGLRFIVDRVGEVFGWSALIEPHIYTASARCTADTKVIKIGKEAIEEIFNKYPADGLIVMRQLAGVIAQRLRNAYRSISSEVAGRHPHSLLRLKVPLDMDPPSATKPLLP